MFEKFAERGRQVIVSAQEAARELEHDYIGTEHLLLGLMGDSEGAAGRALSSAGLSPERVRAQVIRIVGRGERESRGMVPFTPQAQRALQASPEDARAHGQEHAQPEHILLAILRDDGMATRILREFDADTAQIRADVLRSLGPSETGRSL